MRHFRGTCHKGSILLLSTFVYGLLTENTVFKLCLNYNLGLVYWSEFPQQSVLSFSFFPLTSLRVMASGVINSSVTSSTRLWYKWHFKLEVMKQERHWTCGVEKAKVGGIVCLCVRTSYTRRVGRSLHRKTTDDAPDNTASVFETLMHSLLLRIRKVLSSSLGYQIYSLYVFVPNTEQRTGQRSHVKSLLTLSWLVSFLPKSHQENAEIVS